MQTLTPLTPQIRKAEEPEICNAIFRLRFTTLISEMGLPCSDQARSDAYLQDDADTTGHLFFAMPPNGKLGGTARINLLREGIPATFDFLLRAIGDEVPAIDTLSITSRMAVSPSYRNTPLAARLGIAVYQYGLEQGIHHDVIFLQPALVPIYLRMGYKNLSVKMLQHPQGVVIPMLLEVRNWDYLDSIGSICRRAPSFGKLSKIGK